MRNTMQRTVWGAVAAGLGLPSAAALLTFLLIAPFDPALNPSLDAPAEVGFDRGELTVRRNGPFPVEGTTAEDAIVAWEVGTEIEHRVQTWH